MGKIRVMVVDDHDVVRMGLKGYIDAEDDLEVVGEASSGSQALALARIHKPDVVIMDVRMPDGSGIDACRELRNENPGTGIIMLTSYSDDHALRFDHGRCRRIPTEAGPRPGTGELHPTRGRR